MGTVYLVLDQTSTNTKSNKTTAVSNKIWTQEMEKDLIKLVKEERGLWEPGNEFYQKRSYRWYAFNRISNKMKVLWPNYVYLFGPLALIQKFRNFRNYYLRELKKVRRDSRLIARWCHFEDLSFLENTFAKGKPRFIYSSPVVIQFPDQNRKCLKKMSPKKNLKNPNMKSKTKPPAIKDSISNEEENSETSHETAQSFSDLEETTTKQPKKTIHNEEENSETSHETAQFFTDLEEMAIKQPKKKQLTVESVSNSQPIKKQLTLESASTSQHFCNASLKTMTHDEAFANFVAKDLAKIPESQQKEELRFKIVELIHHCKMDTNFLFMDTSLGLTP